ncbi:hypothetical protein P5491_012850 [Priestia megaterium]|uniref:hypothetical protein n=1 Tax=Priestia megaterium TaxID=1404 RepID=UPI00245304F0|nr:hypothetical protein [Priestia megaterium]MDH3141987.1 hypothetical protein [Priestia megaterium]
MGEEKDKVKDAEEHLRLLAEETDEYFYNLCTAEISANKQFTPFLTVAGSMWDNLTENLRTLVFYFKLLVSGVLFLVFDKYLYSVSSLPLKGKIAVGILVVIPFLMYWRRVTIDRMTTPGDDLFHFGSFEKFRKVEHKAFSKLISQKFSPKSFKEDLRKVSLDEKIIEDYSQGSSHLRETNLTYIQLLKEYKEAADKVSENLELTERERNLYAEKTKQMSAMIEQLRTSFKSIASQDFNKNALNNLSIGFNYSIYELEGDFFKVSNFGGVNESELPDNIRTSETTNEIIKAYKKGEDEFRGEKNYLMYIPVSTNVKVVVQLHLDNEMIEKLNDELHPEHNLAKISIQIAFKQFWICLFVYHTTKRLIEATTVPHDGSEGVGKNA